MSGKIINIQAVGGTNTGGDSVTYPATQARVSVDHGVDGLGQIGDYNLPFKSVRGAVGACRAAILATPALAGQLVVYVEAGTYALEFDWIFSGTIDLAPGVIVTTSDILFQVNNSVYSNVPNSVFQLRGNGHITGADFTHLDQTMRHAMLIECDYLQFNTMEVATEFVLKVGILEVTNEAQLYLVDSIHIDILRVRVAAAVSTVLFNINAATTPGTLVNNASSIHIQDVEVEDTGRVYLTNFLGLHEKHTIDVRVESAQGCVIIARGRVTGDLTSNFAYKAQFDNALSAEDHSLFETEDNGVINVRADITNFSYLNRGVRAGARGNSFINLDLRLISYSSLRAVYIEAFDQSSVTLNGTVDAWSSGSQVGIYVYAPNEPPGDDPNNGSNLYFQNVSLRQLNESGGGYAIWNWSGANHAINILGSYALVGLWLVEKSGQIIYKYNTILPISAQLTRQLIVATAAQVIFPSMYKLWLDRLQVIMNGITLEESDYSLTTTDLTLALPAEVDDEIVLENFDAEPIIYPMTVWATTGPTSALSVPIDPITFVTPVTDPLINAVLTGPDIAGDGVKYTTIPNAEDPTAYLSYEAVQDAGKVLTLISVSFAARLEDELDSPVIVKIQASNDSFVTNWESGEYEFTTEGYVTKQWYVPGRLFSPDKNTSAGIAIRVLIYHNTPGTAQGVLFNNFTLKGYHKP